MNETTSVYSGHSRKSPSPILPSIHLPQPFVPPITLSVTFYASTIVSILSPRDCVPCSQYYQRTCTEASSLRTLTLRRERRMRKDIDNVFTVLSSTSLHYNAYTLQTCRVQQATETARSSLTEDRTEHRGSDNSANKKSAAPHRTSHRMSMARRDWAADVSQATTADTLSTAATHTRTSR